MEQREICFEDAAASNTILIVDDDAVNRAILRKLFSDSYTIHEADNGLRGLGELLDPQKRFCAVLLDVMMPEMNGIEVLRRINPLGIPENTPVFLITSETNENVVREAYMLGVMDVIRKPVVSYVVRRRVESVIELFEARRHLSSVVEAQQMKLLDQANRIIELNRGMIEALATAIEFRNEESGGHVQRISEITRFMLENTTFGTGLGREDIDNIALAAIMHDVGKITIPDAILTKPGKLTPDEYEVMKTHTTKGVVILERVPQLRDSGIYDYACDIARHHHHERWDGMGLSGRAEGRRDNAVGAGSGAGRCLRRFELQESIQGGVFQRNRTGDDTHRTVRGFQSSASGQVLCRGGENKPNVSQYAGGGRLGKQETSAREHERYFCLLPVRRAGGRAALSRAFQAPLCKGVRTEKY